MVFITIGLNLLLIPRWGVNGAAAATAMSIAIVNVVCMVEVWYLLRMQPYNASILKPLVASLIASTLTYLLLQIVTLSLLLQLVIGGIFLWGSYVLILFVLHFNGEDLLVVRHLSIRLGIKLHFPWKQARKPL